MYSRKYIRSGSSSALPRTEGRVTLPPDYTGTAFIPDRSVRPEDFPETVIPAVPERPAAEPPSLPLREDRAAAEQQSERTLAIDEAATKEPPIMEVVEEDSEDPAAEADRTATDTAQDVAPTQPFSQMPPTDSTAEESPLLTAEFLRSMTLEDLLLCWLLLMLLTCRQEDQIYLLLGLLLLSR